MTAPPRRVIGWHSASGWLRHTLAEIAASLRSIPLILRYTVVGAASIGILGAIWGLLAGLEYLPTLWAAILEGGFLGSLAGGVLGLLGGLAAYLIVALARRAWRRVPLTIFAMLVVAYLIYAFVALATGPK